MITNPLLAVGLLLFAAYWGGRGANLVNLPRISGYLLVGILLSPSLTHVFPQHLIDRDLHVITESALGLIAYTIGGSLVLERIRHLGRIILCITLTQALGAFIFTAGILLPTLPLMTHLDGPDYSFATTCLPLALVIGAISVATAPGAILAIISELKVKGPFTSILLGIIALDDGLAVVFFAVASTVAHALVNPGTVAWWAVIGEALIEISLSALLGVMGGLVLKFTSRVVHRREAMLMVVLGVVLSTVGAALTFELSPLLASMVIGFVIANMERHHQDFFTTIEQIDEPIFGLFFSLAGAHMDIVVFKSAGLLAMAILIYRMLGKQLGTSLGAKWTKAPAAVQRYLGLALFPQAGVTVGLVLLARDIFPQPEVAGILVNAVIGSVILNELIAPPLVKHALLKADQITENREYTDEVC